MNAMQGITFERDTKRRLRYIRVDENQHAEALRPFVQMITPSLEDWEEGLTSEEFLLATKQMLKRKFDNRNQIS